MTKKDFYFSSANIKARMRAVEWLPEGEPKAVFHMFHGAAKTSFCQEEVAEYFKEHGYVVVESGCPDSVTEIQVQEAMYTCLTNLKRKYPDVPYLLMGMSQGVPGVCAYISAYPETVEGVILVDADSDAQPPDKDFPILQLSDVKENRQEAFHYIYKWTEERLDEMLYQAANKH